LADRALLRERLGELARARRVRAAGSASGSGGDGGAGGTPADGAEEARTPGAAGGSPAAGGAGTNGNSTGRRSLPSEGRVGVEEFLPGGEWRDEHGAVYVHERLRSELEKPRGHWGSLGSPPAGEPDLVALASLGLDRALFLDLETGGLASSPVFLAGTMHWNGRDFVLRQYFARHYGEEGALLSALGEGAKGFDFLVTFNGKSYDAPLLASRAIVHGMAFSLPPRHLDLLHPARRRWKLQLPDCRLQTLETHVCRRRRSGDVPSDEVPALYHDYVRHGDPYRLIPVFHHNLLDVITMGEILRTLCTSER
jgi:hypothetical protein